VGGGEKAGDAFLKELYNCAAYRPMFQYSPKIKKK